MLSLLRRDPVLGLSTRVWVVMSGVVALNAVVLAGLLATLAAGSGAWAFGAVASKALLAPILWFTTSLFLFFGKTGQRCQLLDMALPIPARKLWLAHILALVLVGLTCLALSAGVLRAVFGILENTRADSSTMLAALAGLILPIVSIFLLAAVLLQSPAPSLYQTPSPGRRLLLSIPVICLAPGVVLVLSLLPPPVMLLPLGITFWLGWRTYRAVPPAFTLVPREAVAGDPGGEERHEGAQAIMRAAEWERNSVSGAPGTWGIGWHLLRLLYVDPRRMAVTSMFLFPLYVGWGLLISGLPAAWRYADLPQFSYVILTGYLLLSFLPAQMKRLPVIDAWPVSRRRLFAFLMLPPLLALAAGLGSGRIGALLLEKSRPQILYQQKESAFFPPYPWKTPLIRVPAQYCGIAWDGRPPELTSPWGESRPAWSHPLYRGSRIVVYAPFSTSEVGSPRFVALQISRAIQAIYGKSVPWEEVLSRYLETEGDGGVRLKGGELALLADYPDLEPQGDIPLFPLLLLMSATVWLIMAGVFLRSCRAHVTDAGRVRTFAVLAAFAIATTMAQLGVMVAGLLRPDAGAAFLRILLLRYAAAAPGGEWILWIVCLLWLFVLYGLVQNRFDRIEVLPGRPVPE